MTKQEITRKFSSARNLFPITQLKNSIIYFNSASAGPLCRPVKKVLDEYYDYSQYLHYGIDIEAFAALDKIRKLGAKLIGARQDEVGFGFNTGFGLNIAASGLPLKRGDEVLLSDIEFPSNVYPWLALKQQGVKVKFIKSENRFFDIDNFIRAITRKTKLLSLSFVQFFNGYKNDLKKIGTICKENGIYFIVDGIQGCGVETINVHKYNIDIFSSGAQKWLLSPLGTGLFYVKKELQDKLSKPFASWLSVDWGVDFSDLFHYDLPFFKSARQYEMGTYPYAHVFAMKAALELIDSLGVRNIQRHNHDLLDILIDYLNSNGFYEIKSSLENRHRSSILSFTCPEVLTVYRALLTSNIICAYREGAIRVAVHLFNNESDIRQLISVLRTHMKSI
jgi:selenocysteine lyase/cysteine desulfurase